MRLDLTLNLPDLLYAAGESRCHPKIFVAECAESILAGRRAKRLPPAAYGAQCTGTRRAAGRAEEDAELDWTEYRVIHPIHAE